MKVAALQSFVRTLLPPLEEAGASEKARSELRKMAECLEPFAALEVGAFAELLTQAQEYRATGVLPVAATKPARARSTAAKAPKPSPLSIEEAAARVLVLHERAVDPSLQYQEIDAEMEMLNKALDKDKAIAVAKQVGITKSLKSKKAAIDEIKRMIVDRKGAFERTDFRTVTT